MSQPRNPDIRFRVEHVGALWSAVRYDRSAIDPTYWERTNTGRYDTADEALERCLLRARKLIMRCTLRGSTARVVVERPGSKLSILFNEEF